MKIIYDCKIKVAILDKNGVPNMKNTHVVNLVSSDMLHPDDFRNNDSIKYHTKMDYILYQLSQFITPARLKYGVVVLSFLEKRPINTELNFKNYRL